MSQGGRSLFCSIYSYQPLSPPPRSRSPPGNDSWRHTQDRSARHTPRDIKDFQQGQKRKLNLSAGQSYVWPTNSEEVRPEPAWGRKTFDVWFIRLFWNTWIGCFWILLPPRTHLLCTCLCPSTVGSLKIQRQRYQGLRKYLCKATFVNNTVERIQIKYLENRVQLKVALLFSLLVSTRLQGKTFGCLS